MKKRKKKKFLGFNNRDHGKNEKTFSSRASRSTKKIKLIKFKEKNQDLLKKKLFTYQ